MAQHKAPTAVSVAPVKERTPLEQWVARYWVHCSLVLIAIVAGVVVRHFMTRQKQTARVNRWASIGAETTNNRYTNIPEGDPEEMARLAVELRSSAAGPSVRLLEIRSRIEKGDYDGATAALATLRQDFPEHPLVTDTVQLEDGTTTTLPDTLAARIEELRAWYQAHPELEANPAPPPDGPRVRLNTSAGSILLALYGNKALRHSDNFLKLCREGYYDGTRFHRIVKGFMIQGGDPNSRDEDKSTWGQGGPEEKIDPEPNDLHHFMGVLSAAKQPGETRSSGSQFFITTDPAHHLNGQHVIFGAVLEGMDVVTQIVDGAADPASPSQDQPLDPVTIESVEVLAD